MSNIFPNLSNVLFSKTRQGVLRLLYGHPDKDFHTNEIIRITNTGTGAVQKELKQLSGVGLILAELVGNQKRYKANRTSPLFKELQSITLKTFGIGDVLQEALAPFSKNIQIAFIYGSIAKQSDTVNSDVDLMIIGNNLTYSDLFTAVIGIESQLERKINPTFHTKQDWKQRVKEKNNFLIQIINQPKILLIGTEDELNKLG